jgi:hypothetical protein
MWTDFRHSTLAENLPLFENISVENLQGSEIGAKS